MKSHSRRIIDKYLVERKFDRGLKELSERTGIPYITLQKHIKNPSNFKGYELRVIADTLQLSDEDLASLIRQR